MRSFALGALAVAGAAAATAAVVGSVAALWPAGGSPGTPVASPESDLAPAGMRLVGLAGAAVAVPQEWATNAHTCGTPISDTVVIDLGPVLACAAPRPAGVDSVEVTSWAPRSGFTADETFEIDGVSALRQSTACQPDLADEAVDVCAGTVHIPSMGVYFRAESSTDAEADRILERIQILPDRIGVPGFRGYLLNEQEDGEIAYLDALEKAGLVPDVQPADVPLVSPGPVVDVSPEPGTMLKPGDFVTVTVAAQWLDGPPG
jgi:hypothetical protein